MAFEAFMRGNRGRWTRGRRITVGASVALHAALIVVGVTHSVWNVEELNPDPPPLPPLIIPPPPPRIVDVKLIAQKKPPGGGNKDRDRPGLRAPVPPVQRPPAVAPDVPRPPGPPTEERDPYETKPGIGSIGDPKKPIGPGDRERPGHSVSWEIARHQVLYGPMPRLPNDLKQVGSEHQATAKVCVSAAGSVVSIAPVRATLPAVSQVVVAAVSTWRYRPYTVNGHAVPFCYLASFDFRVE